MGRIETIIDISDKRVAQNQIRNYFEKYLRILQAVIACPGGLYRSERISIYLEALKLARCPYNKKQSKDGKYFVPLSYSRLLNIDFTNVDLVVLCDELTERKIGKIAEIAERIPNKVPVILLNGMEGQFTYLCWEATVE